MYCPSCGTAVIQSVSYCTRCGANLNKEDGKSPTEDLLDGIFWTTVFGLGLIVGGVAVLKGKGVREALVIGYMILSTLAFLGIYGMHVWLFFRLHRRDKETAQAVPFEGKETRELLEAAEPAALPEPLEGSVTEGTTRSFEPVYRRHEKSR